MPENYNTILGIKCPVVGTKKCKFCTTGPEYIVPTLNKDNHIDLQYCCAYYDICEDLLAFKEDRDPELIGIVYDKDYGGIK